MPNGCANGRPFLHVGEQFTDFADTAAIISNA